MSPVGPGLEEVSLSLLLLAFLSFLLSVESVVLVLGLSGSCSGPHSKASKYLLRLWEEIVHEK